MKVFIGIFVLLLLLHQAELLHPVLLIPGDGGSQVMAKYIEDHSYICGFDDDWFTLWLNLYYFTPFTINCFTEAIKLDYNPLTKTTSSPKICETKVIGFGLSDSVEYFSPLKTFLTSYFHNVIDALVKILGYVRNKSIRGAPYDFRKAPNEMTDFVTDLKKLIEDMYLENDNNSVIIVAHSMGNLYMTRLLYFMSQPWKDKYIKTFVSISAPYAGTVDAVRTALSGNNLHISFLSAIHLRSAQNTWPSTYYLMPNPKLWSSNLIAATKKGNYSAHLLSELLKESGIEYAEDHFKDAKSTWLTPTAPNVTVHCIYSNDVQTSEFLDYKNGEFPENKPGISYGPGDGTVNLQSLQHCTNWKGEQNQSVTTTIIPGVNHLAILRDKHVVKLITDIVDKCNAD